jgi:hypothetical protein
LSGGWAKLTPGVREQIQSLAADKLENLGDARLISLRLMI